MENFNKEKWSFIAAYGSLSVGFALLIAGFIVPPVGEISNSVLMAFAQILVFVGSIFGISLHIDNKMGIVRAEMKSYIEKKGYEGEKRRKDDDELEE